MESSQSGRENLAYTFRRCQTRKELLDCARLQKRIWGLEDRELYPQRIFVVANKIGGGVLGAFDRKDRLAGFLIWLPARDDQGCYDYSLSLGVSRAHRNRGLGRALKWEQRRLALQAGIDRIRWTFDPLQIKNAFFNLERLGAVACRYIPDHYGRLSVNVRAGLATDRLEVEWRLRSERVRGVLQGLPLKIPDRTVGAAGAEIELPMDVWRVSKRDPQRARVLQKQARQEFLRQFARGLVATGVRMGAKTATYRLERYED